MTRNIVVHLREDEYAYVVRNLDRLFIVEGSHAAFIAQRVRMRFLNAIGHEEAEQGPNEQEDAS